jgi:hypothetical protein
MNTWHTVYVNYRNFIVGRFGYYLQQLDLLNWPWVRGWTFAPGRRRYWISESVVMAMLVDVSWKNKACPNGDEKANNEAGG